MSPLCRRFLCLALSLAAIMIFTSVALAECDTDCDPYHSSCGQVCQICTRYTQDGCSAWRNSTCGDQAGGCIQSGCTPNWVEQSRVTEGTYGAAGPSECNHHAMQWVTTTDVNHCNTNSAFYSQSYCDNVIDAQKTGGWYPDCCDGWDGFGNWNPIFLCNGYHSCTSG